MKIRVIVPFIYVYRNNSEGFIYGSIIYIYILFILYIVIV